MVACTTCAVESQDSHCGHDEHYCHNCCTTSATINTCLYHFRVLGNIAQATRFASGKVTAEVTGFMTNKTASLLSPAPSTAPPAAPSQLPSPAVVSSAATAASIAALRAELEADRAAAQVERAAMQAQLAEQSATSRRMMAMLAALHPSAPIISPPAAVNHPLQPPPSPPVSVPAAHRAAVLDRAAAAPEAAFDPSAGLLARGHDDEDDDDAHEVRSHAHIHGAQAQPNAILPAAFVPTPSGTAQNAQQQLAALFNGLAKQGSKVKYATISELNEALDDWATDSLGAGWTAAQIESIRAYQRLLIVRLTVSERWPLKDVLEYHRKWCKAVHAGTIDMFARGAELNLVFRHEVQYPIVLGAPTASASSTVTAKSGKSKDTSTAAASSAKTTAARTPPAAKPPAGSCTNHPASTSHTTAECKKQ